MAMSPRNAALLSLLLPGSAHFALGRPARGAIAMVTTLALFFVGWSVLQERLWFYAVAQPSGRLKLLFTLLPIQLMPEAMNLGATAAASLLRAPESFAAERLARMPLAAEYWATMLTGSSGVLSVLWASDAHWLARGGGMVPAKVSPAFAAFLSWLVPGLGHARAGQAGKGWLMGAAVVVVFVLGLVISRGHGVDRQFFGLWWSAVTLFAPGLLVVSLATGPLQLAGEIPPLLDYGVAMCTCAGLMNAMVMSDAYTVAERGALAPAHAVQEVAA